MILLKNLPFVLREPRDERQRAEMVEGFPSMLSSVEAFLGVFSRIRDKNSSGSSHIVYLEFGRKKERKKRKPQPKTARGS
jgi:hypothetical protein